MSDLPLLSPLQLEAMRKQIAGEAVCSLDSLKACVSLLLADREATNRLCELHKSKFEQLQASIEATAHFASRLEQRKLAP